MIAKIKQKIVKLLRDQDVIIAQNKELEWANIYHDTIRGKKYLENLGISPGRWAGGYAFLYVVTRILADYKPKNIIEFGLGESSKLISTIIENELPDSKHLIIEQSEDWVQAFSSRFKLSDNTTIRHLPLEVKEINGHPVNCYANLKETVKDTFDLYLIDGPFGSNRYSRYDICVLADNLTKNNEFVILIDDTNRQGEKDTALELVKLLNSKGIKTYTGDYVGSKTQTLITTEKYKYTLSM